MISGPIEYSIRFYRIEDASTPAKKQFKFLYNLNTMPATSKVLYGMDVQTDDLSGKFNIEPTLFDALMAKIDAIQKQDIYWIELK